MYRQMPGANKLLKEHEWASVLNWLREKREEDAGGITATSKDDDPDGPRQNLLCTAAQFRPLGQGKPSAEHQASVLHIVRSFYAAGLINMRIGKHRETALLRAAGVGNLEVGALLLEYGAGIPLWLLSGLFIRNYFPAGGHPFFRLGLRRGGCGV